MRDDVSPAYPGVGTFLLTVLAPFGFGYFLSYLYRAVNAVAAPDLVRDLGLDAAGLGFLTAAYLVAFAAFQLPLGILLDRYGPRRVQSALIGLTGVSALTFGLAGNFTMLAIARAGIGIGSAGGLMSGFKAVSLWVSEPRRPLANALIMAVGGLGLITATVPAEFAVSHWGWRALFAGLAGLSLLSALLIFLLVPEQPHRDGPAPSWRRQVRGLGIVFADPVFWRIAPLVAATCGCHIGIQTLWAGPWLADVAGLDRAGVAQGLAAMALGFLVGTLISGAVADRLATRGISVLWVSPVFVLVFLVIEALLMAGVTRSPLVLAFAFGMFGQSAILLYPWLASYFGGAHAAGRSNAALNLLSFGVAFATQYGFGAVLDLWPSIKAGSYDPQGYRAALAICFTAQALAFLWFLARPPASHARSENQL